ncbi:hypothetical protein LIA77_06783 [Sarocladium implicatum]|nr:hypothetical protein LIA77_06783 [Sarocladium implicatum]
MNTHKITSPSSYLTGWVLAPFWIVRLGLLIFHFAYFLYINVLLVRFFDDALSLYIVHEIRDGGFTRVLLTGISIAVIAACIVFEIICILKYFRVTLSYGFLLFATALQAVMWTAIFATSMALYHDRIIRATGITLAISLYGLLGYAAFASFKGGQSPNYATFQDEEHTSLKEDTSYDPMRRTSVISHASIQPPPPSRYEPVRESS